MNIQIKAIASDLWEVYDLDKSGDEQIVGSAPTEIEAEDLASQYESQNA